MAYSPVSIESHYSPNPSKQENYTVTCHSHRVRTTVTARPSVVRKWVTTIHYRDAQLLRDCRHRLQISRLVDVRHVAYDLRGCSRGASMERLAEEVVGMEGVEKKEWVGRSDWDEEWLSREQVEYACVDAFMAFVIAKELRVWKWIDYGDQSSSDSDY